MTSDKLKNTMRELDFTSADVATVMGVTRRTVQLWLAGSNPVPLSTSLVLHGILEGLLPLEWVEDKIVQDIQVT